MKRSIFSTIMVLLALMLAVPMTAAAESEAAAFQVILPPGYETDGLNYPVVYVLPQNGFAADDSGLADKLAEAMKAGTGAEMIIVLPSFAEGSDAGEEMNAVIAQVDEIYRTIAAPEYRAAVGTGVGGYLAYALALEEESPFGAAASIRGDFVSSENPWLPVFGEIQERMEDMHREDEAVFDGFYTYMDAPVDDAWTNMKGSTNDLGALMIGFGAGSAFHEYTVRPGAYTEAFLTESVSRLADRLTGRMLSGLVGGTLELDKTTLSANESAVGAAYAVTVSEAISAHVADETTMEVSIAMVDSQTGQILAETAHTHAVAGAGEYAGEIAFADVSDVVSADVTLSAKLLGTKAELASSTLIRAQEAVIDGDYQKIELAGDWYFNYVGTGKSIDVSKLTPAEYQTWSVVQPGLTSWEKGFGNISDENVRSGYGPDYFNYFIVGNGYYARSFAVPENFDAEELVLAIGYVDDRCEVFLNGERVGATGMDGKGRPTGETTWAVFSSFEIDPAQVNVGGENTVVVRAWNDEPYGAGGWYGGPTGLYSKSAFEALFGGGENPRFYEETFTSGHAAKALREGRSVENQYLIYLPESYEESGRSYPTVYLLHQFNSDHTSYRTDKVDQLLDAGIAAGLFDEMIVVIPNSSEESWWSGEWEKMITEELIPAIDANYRTIRDARYRMTAGCSMGGQGAFSVALRNPDYFSGMISFFGAFSYGGANSPNMIAMQESREYLDSFTMYFICGNQDSYGFGVPAIALNQQLEALGVDHRFFIENGGHDSAFYVPFFSDGFSYVRKNMYHSDAAVEALLSGSVSISGALVQAEFAADAGIAAYMYAVPDSSYTKNPAPALSTPLTVEVIQDGETVCAHTARDVLVSADDLSETISFDLAGLIDPERPASIVFRAEIFDRAVTLSEIEIPAE